MKRDQVDQVTGLDFGTTNSAIAVGTTEGRVALATFSDGARPTSTFRSVLYFPAKEQGADGRRSAVAGPGAISAYLEAETKGRLILSVKSYLASRLFTQTNINGRSYTLEDLISIILKDLKKAAEEQFSGTGTRVVVVGRPVRFSGAETAEDESLALGRLESALCEAGFENVSFEYEPVAAAYQYEQQLDHEELVLIGDFGGGTSDFTLIRLGPSGRKKGHDRSDILGTDGLSVAGDTFDGRVMTHLVAPKLGAGSCYRSLGKDLPVPTWVYSKLSDWHHMSFLKDPRTLNVLRQVRSQAAEPKRIEALIQVIADDLGYELFRAVEGAKVELTSRETATLAFDETAVEIRERIERWQFESWIQNDVQSIAACVNRLMTKCHVTARDVDSVFLTGGSSFVPVVRRFFGRTFGADRVRGGEELTTVAKGLALRALDLL